MGENRVHTYQMLYEILCAVEEYGAELNIELKRKLQKKMHHGAQILKGDAGSIRECEADLDVEQQDRPEPGRICRAAE